MRRLITDGIFSFSPRRLTNGTPTTRLSPCKCNQIIPIYTAFSLLEAPGANFTFQHYYQSLAYLSVLFILLTILEIVLVIRDGAHLMAPCMNITATVSGWHLMNWSYGIFLSIRITSKIQQEWVEVKDSKGPYTMVSFERRPLSRHPLLRDHASLTGFSLIMFDIEKPYSISDHFCCVLEGPSWGPLYTFCKEFIFLTTEWR